MGLIYLLSLFHRPHINNHVLYHILVHLILEQLNLYYYLYLFLQFVNVFVHSLSSLSFLGAFDITNLFCVPSFKSPNKSYSNKSSIYTTLYPSAVIFDFSSIYSNLSSCFSNKDFILSNECNVKICDDNDYNLGISNPCFEFWLLLHFTNCKEYDEEEIRINRKTSKSRNSKRFVEKELAGKLEGSYNKSNLKFEQFKANIKNAIENEKLYEVDIEKLENNIGTRVGLIIEKMIKE